MLLRMGVTFNVYGDEAGSERIFPFDPVPRIIDYETWQTLEAGLIQRVKALNALIGQHSPSCIIVDLSNPGLRIADLIQSLRKICSPTPRVVAYGSHVDTATLRAAREAGCDLVLPRSQFVEELPRALPGWMTAGT